MKLILARHAESMQFFNRIISGPVGCQGLTEKGFVQAQALAERFRGTGEMKDCRVLLSSPVQRTRQTAGILAAALPGCTVEEDPGLCELLPGESDGMTKEEARARYPSFDLLAYPDRKVAPGGESWLDFTGRVRAVMQGLADRYEGQTVLAVTHAGFIVVSVLVLFDIPRPGTGAYLDPDFTGLTEWNYSAGKWQLGKYNDCYHLRE